MPIFVNKCPSDRCDQILWLIKNSDLNYCVQETSFSLNVQLKKKFVNRWESSHSPNIYSQPMTANTSVNKSTLEEELKLELDKLKAEKEVFRDTIQSLETKLAKAESELIKHFKEKTTLSKALDTEVETCKNLKKAINNLQSDAAVLAHDSSCTYKTLKSKEKEIHNLEKKSNNQQDTMDRLKADLADLKVEKAVFEKQIKVIEKKAKKNAKKETKAVSYSESKDENQNPTKTEVISNVNHKKNKGGIACDVCHDLCPSLAELKVHREVMHQEVLNYICKLCDNVFKSEEEHRKHTYTKDHQNLSKSIANQFNLQIGKICDECQICETEDNTTYNICEDDDHLDIFDNIWSNRCTNPV